MLIALVTLLLIQPALSYGWDKDRIAPGPTDCTNEKLTFCGVTFLCKCIWTMPTILEAKRGCGIARSKKR